MFNIYANEYAPIDPLVPPCDINLIPIGHVGEDQTRCLVFDLTDCVNKLGEGTWQISFVRPGDNACYICTNVEELDNSAIWIITDTDTAYAGYGVVQLLYFPTSGGTAKTSQYRTVTFESNGIPGDAPDPYEGLLEQIAQLTSQATAAASTATAAAQEASTAVEEGISTERSQRIAADDGLQVQINTLEAAVGGPLVSNTAAGMTDTSKVYVYTGSESGYTFGHWYYYAGANWADGGVYQASAVETDPTLSVEGMAADAAACGDLKSQIYSAFVTEETSGNIASFTDGADDVPVKDLVVNITPVQAGSGDPSPSNVRAISGYTAANITRVGKNLFDQSQLANASGWAVNDGVYSGTIAQLYVYCNYGQAFPNQLSYKQNTQYTFSFTVTACTGNAYFQFTYTDGTSERVVVATTGDFTRTTSSVKSLSSIWFSYNLGGNLSIGNIQLEVGNTKTGYEPYNGNTYNISFGSAGTVYSGTLDVTSGMLTVDSQMVTYDGTETWNLNDNYGVYTGAKRPSSGVAIPAPLIDRYKSITPGDAIYLPNYTARMNAGRTALQILDPDHMTVASFKEYLQSTTPMQVLYYLANPVSVQLDATTIKTLLGNNNIWSDTGSVESCEYRADTKLYLEKLTNPDSDMTADSNIASGQYFMVNNTLYLATAAIASGATIVPGTNCTETSLAAALNAINA